ncbi:MAG: DUF4159 domain-containing protein [Lentisphaerae bacterium]|nr:DUF4159 domain-containing protein [Lentisphaerota bacterium]
MNDHTTKIGWLGCGPLVCGFAAILVILFLAAAPLLAKEGTIQCANLIYGGTHTSRCFSDEFLSSVQKETTIPTERRFKSVKLGSEELFQYPFVMMTGEASFHFSRQERDNLKKYLTRGGFLLASAGCSNKEWDRAFRREMRALFNIKALKKLDMTHPLFHTVHEIKALKLTHGGENARLEGVEWNGKLVVVYSPQGLNDTAHSVGCCCCGGNEIGNSLEMNVNIFVYALLY